MRKLPVKKLTADIIELGGKLLINQNGDLYFNDELLAKYEDLIGISVVSNTTDMGFLTPKNGDVVKNTETSEMYIWNGVWQPMYREKVKVHTVSTSSELQFLNAVAGDIANITAENASSIYAGGGEWSTILTGDTGAIDDEATTEHTTWSSIKIQNELDTHDHDGGVY